MSADAGGEAVEPASYSTMALAVAVLVLMVVIGGALLGPPGGIVLGPTVDVVGTPRLMRLLGRTYSSLGGALWSLVFAAVGLLPVYAIVRGTATSSTDALLLQALGFTVPGLIVGAFALRGRYRRLAALGAGASTLVGGLAALAYGNA